MLRRPVWMLSLVVAVAAAAPLAHPVAAGATVVWAVGDGGVPEPEDDQVADRIQQEGIDRFVYLGDVYEHGTAEEFRRNFAPSFGRFKWIGRPTPGNHEWDLRAEGYDAFWGERAPQTDGGHYYTFEIAGWRFFSMNSEENAQAGSAQVEWLKRQLATYRGTCTIAFWHKPRYSAGPSRRDNGTYEALWAALAGRAVAVLAGHDHNYQRLRPERGITPFIVGTGGRTRYAITDPADPRLVAATDDDFGALRWNLQTGRADFEFVAVDGRRLDSGSLSCIPNEPVIGGRPPAVAPPPASPPPAAVQPSARILAPRDRATHTRRLSVLRGRAAVPAGARHAIVLTRRTRSGRCRAWDGRGLRASCRRPPLVTRRGPSWRLRLPRRPLAGRYRLVSVVRGSDGVLARAAVSFRVR